jgi:hypothetical protein
MYKNFRVGKLKYVANKRGGIGKHILVDVMEYCVNRSGGEYESHPTYNLWISFDDKYDISSSDVGRWCEVGFYIQSFREKDLHEHYSTVLSMRSFRFLETDEEAVAEARRISESILTHKQ